MLNIHNVALNDTIKYAKLCMSVCTKVGLAQ